MTVATVAAVVGVAGTAYNIYNASQQQSMGQQAIQNSDPFGPYRKQYADKLSTLMANPSSVTKDPGYQFGMDSAMQGTARQMASTGFLGSGNEALALQNTGFGYANNYYQNSLKTLADLAGAGTVPNATGAGLQAYNQGSSNMNDAFGQLGAMAKTWGGTGGSNTSLGPAPEVGYGGPTLAAPSYTGPAFG